MAQRNGDKMKRTQKAMVTIAVLVVAGLTVGACGSSSGSSSGSSPNTLTIQIPSSSQATKVQAARVKCERAIRSDALVTQATITTCNVSNMPSQEACPTGPPVWEVSVGQLPDPTLLRIGHRPEVYVASTTTNPNPANEFVMEDSARLCGTPMDTTGVLTPPTPPLTPSQVRALAPVA